MRVAMTAAPHAAELFFSYSSSEIAAAVAGALSPEAALAEVPKTRATINVTGPQVRVAIQADDLPSLRAAVNSYARWVDAAERAARSGQGGRGDR